MKGIFLVVLFTTFVAQAVPGCGTEGGEVIGYVDEKYTSRASGDIEYVLVVNRVPYNVPAHFWLKADVGDIVKYDGFVWTIVRKRS